MRPPREPRYASAQGPLYAGIIILSILACAARPSPYRWLLFLPICSMTAFYFYTRSHDLMIDFSNAAFISMNLFMMSDFLLLTDVQNELRRKGERADVHVSQQPFFDRLKWAFDLLTSNRGVGWEHEPSAYLPHWRTTAKTRLAGVRQQFLGLAEAGALYVIAEVLFVVNPSFRTDGPPFHSQPWWLWPSVLAHVLAARSGITGVYSIAGIVSISLGLSEPNRWPPLFGSFLDAYTVQNVWGRVWHQMFRRFLTAHANFAVKLIQPSNKVVRSLIKLFTAFFISSLAHYFIDCMGLETMHQYGAFKFWMSQAIAITLESASIHFFRWTGIQVVWWVKRAVGYVWVLCWFSMTVPFWVEPVIRAGFLENGLHFPLMKAIGEGIKEQLGIVG
ncbi:hypothetical protein NMY22_g19764 [Coprinellus aureogranulatus]|nr:hypothetical protein NMY22_g19764 [Coprinellus aureogranulatus]